MRVTGRKQAGMAHHRPERRSVELTEFEKAGINPEELGFMRAAERRAVLEHAGLNPDEYDF